MSHGHQMHDRTLLAISALETVRTEDLRAGAVRRLVEAARKANASLLRQANAADVGAGFLHPKIAAEIAQELTLALNPFSHV